MSTDFLSIPAKKPSDVDLVKPLKNLISSNYNTADNPGDYTDAIQEFSRLRNNAVWKSTEKQEGALETVYCYYDELAALDSKVSGSTIQASFKWKDAFGKGSFFSGRSSFALSSLKYERVCLLFNMAALQNACAANQSLDTDDGLKLSAKLFQQSAGIFKYLKENVAELLAQDTTADLHPDVLAAFTCLMLAHAQEIFVYKAIHDQMKDAIIAKLSSHCEDLYTEAYKLVTTKEAVHGLVPVSFETMVLGKKQLLHGVAEYYQSMVCKSNRTIGEQIARLKVSLNSINSGQRTLGKPLFYEIGQKAKRLLSEAEKDNNFIYHDRIPEYDSLERVPPAALAKPIPLPSQWSSGFKDLFRDLVPVSVHQALAAYDVRRTELMNVEVNKLRESTQFLNSVLASLNLPAALEDTCGSSLPPSLVEKADLVMINGGVQSISNMIQELPDLLNRNQQILDEAERLMREEKESDDSLRSQFGEKWTRNPSEKLTETFRSNCQAYKKLIENAVNADQIVRNQYNQHKRAMELLSTGKEAIEAALPSGSSSGMGATSILQSLKQLMEEVEKIKAERDAIESDIKSATTDMKGAFLSALARDGAINEAELSVDSLQQTYSPLQKQVNESLEKQEVLLREIQNQNTQFCQERAGNEVNTERNEFLKELAAGFDAFNELQKNLKEGTKFYNELTQHLVTFQNKVSDFCFARRTEKEELLKTLTQDMSRSSTDAPTAPSIYADVNRNPPARPPPARPPPPSVDGSKTLPYPTQPMGGMPLPYAPMAYAGYLPPPMPATYNPYATMPQMHGYQYQMPYPTQQYPTYPQYPPQQ